MTTSSDELDQQQYIMQMAHLLGLSIDPGWEGSVMTNLDLMAAAAEQVLSFPLDDDAESALVFKPL